MGNDKAERLLNEFLEELPEESRSMYREIAEYAMSLGYFPKKTTSKDFALDFPKSRVKRTILKMEVHSNAIKSNDPGLRLKFYACGEYSEVFQEGIRKVIEEFGGKYTGCYGCGRCGGKPEGYTFRYPDGKKVFRCGGELIAVSGVGPEHVPEIRELIRKQDEFFLSKIS